MKRAAILISAAILLSGCSVWSDTANPGNPGGSAYAGEAGGVFDTSGSPRPVKADVYERPSSTLLPAPGAKPDVMPPAPAAPAAPR